MPPGRPTAPPSRSCPRSLGAPSRGADELRVPDRSRPFVQLVRCRESGATASDTSNTRATVTKAVPNGHLLVARSRRDQGRSGLRLVDAELGPEGVDVPRRSSSGRSRARASRSPRPLDLTWSPVPRAAHYLVSLATDEDLASLVGATRDKPIKTAGTSFAPSLTPAGARGKTYYWAVTPLDAQGNRGAQSRIGSFVWDWPSQTTAKLTDLRDEARDVRPAVLLEPGRRCAPLRGRGELVARLRAGSKVCCDTTVIGTVALADLTAPRQHVLLARSRGRRGRQRRGLGPRRCRRKPVREGLRQGRGTRPSEHPEPAHARQHAATPPRPGRRRRRSSSGVTSPGPRATSSRSCRMSASATGAPGPLDHWRVTTATTAWSPLGFRLQAPAPYPDKRRVSDDSARLVAGKSYCVRVRARSPTATRRARTSTVTSPT